MCKLVLNVGDTVRNINPSSGYMGKVGTVVAVSNSDYSVLYANKPYATAYGKVTAHRYLEKVVGECPCQQPLFKVNLAHTEGEEMMINFIKRRAGDTGIYYIQPAETKRHVLKKVRRNVLTGKTQDDHVKRLGHAQGVAEFNTRALGKSTGQALHAIGSAMMNPCTPIRITGIDHAICGNGFARNTAPIDKNFRSLVQSLIGNMKGFTFIDTHIVFNPIVTEETYVEL